MDYKFRTGFHAPKGLSAIEVAKELERVSSLYGKLTAPILTEESAKEDALLHSYFEWDDAVCGRIHREHQASTLIRAIIIEDDSDAMPIYVSVQIQENDRREYLPTMQVVNEETLYIEALSFLRQKLFAATQGVKELEKAAKKAGKDTTKIKKAGAVLKKAQQIMQGV